MLLYAIITVVLLVPSLMLVAGVVELFGRLTRRWRVRSARMTAFESTFVGADDLQHVVLEMDLGSENAKVEEVRPAVLSSKDDLVTGDDSFDETFLVRGRPAEVHALLDAQARSQIRQHHAVVEHGMLRLHIDGGRARLSDHANLEALANRLSRPHSEIPARLARNVREDPLFGVRRRCLEVLIEAYPDSAEAQAALEHASNAPDFVIRAMARIFLARGTMPEPELLRYLREEHPDVKRYAADALASVGGRDAIERLSSYADAQDPRLRAAVLGAIERIRSRIGETAGGRLSLASRGGELSKAERGGELAKIESGGELGFGEKD